MLVSRQVGRETPGAIKFSNSNSEYKERSVALLYFSWRVFICWDCLQSSSHHVVRMRWGLYHFLTCGCRKSQTNHASLRNLCTNCVRNCILETTPAYSKRYFCCRKTKLRGHGICLQDAYKPVSSLVSIFCHKAVSCSKNLFVIHKAKKRCCV
jgi:hypothetical protein